LKGLHFRPTRRSLLPQNLVGRTTF
jgi:hypothetical protein